jgi:holliday junction DNA helicase RuvB
MSDINDAKPTSLSHIVGQRSVVDQQRVALDAAFEDGKRLDDCLLVGPPGVGKTQVASVLAQELAVKCHETLGQSINSPAGLNTILLSAKDKEIVLIGRSTRPRSTSPLTSGRSAWSAASPSKASRWRSSR